MNNWKSKLSELIKETSSISYDEERKKEFKKLGKDFLKKVVCFIPAQNIKESKVSYNAGGIAVSGDHSLYVMFENGKGACVFFSHDGFMDCVTFRTISNMKDFSGGSNLNKGMGILTNPLFVAAELLKLGGYEGSEVLNAT